MKNIDQLPVSQQAKDKILESDQNFRRFSKVRTDILKVKDKTITIRIEQFDKPTDSVLSKSELVKIGQQVIDVSELSEYRKYWRPLEFEGSGLDVVSPDWVKNQMKKHGLYQKDLVDLLGVDKYVLSKLLNNKYEFTRWHKAAFYYLFKSI